MVVMRVAVLSALLLLTACQASGAKPPASVTSSPVASVSQTPAGGCAARQTAPQFPASGPSSRLLVLASYAKGNDFVVRDITDINHPFTVVNMNRRIDSATRFVSGTELATTSVITPSRLIVNGEGLVRMTFDETRTSVSGCYVEAFAWNPDGTAAAYIAPAPGVDTARFRLVGDGVDQVKGAVAAASTETCIYRECSDNSDVRMLYSPDGAYISFVRQPSVAFNRQSPAASFRIWTSAGELVKSMDGTLATMSVWSGDTLYWRDDKGVETWRHGVQSLLVPGMAWVRPHASPAGGQIVFEVREAYIGRSQVMLLDTKTGQTRTIAYDRSEPAFLTSRYLWYQGERACTSSDKNCVGTTVPTGLTYIYDLQTDQEFRSIITDVWDVWPHAA